MGIDELAPGSRSRTPGPRKAAWAAAREAEAVAALDLKDEGLRHRRDRGRCRNRCPGGFPTWRPAGNCAPCACGPPCGPPGCGAGVDRRLSGPI
jgi:hypothetical protein